MIVIVKKVFSGKQLMEDHVSAIHEGIMIPCDNWGKLFALKGNLVANIKNVQKD